LTNDCKIKANRANARASTGPRTVEGRTRSARNALRHGLSLPVCSDPALCEEVEALARDIAGTDANAEILERARRVAEAQYQNQKWAPRARSGRKRESPAGLPQAASQHRGSGDL
jgi:hypothetical protein